MLNMFKNSVKTAVDRVGGPTKAAHLLGVCNSTVHSWIKRQNISDIDQARALAKASGMSLQDLRRTE